MKFDSFLKTEPYSLAKAEKEAFLTKRLLELTELHRKKCEAYGRILDGIGFHTESVESYYDLPFLPARLFKEMELKSIEDREVAKTVTSSGTSGQQTSRVYLDKRTAANQQRVLARIVSDFTGAERLPMVIIDSPSVLKNRNEFSARGAGILGFSILGTKKIYALDDNMTLDMDGLCSFLDMHRNKKILLFGFTFIVWQHFYMQLAAYKKAGRSIDLSNGILIHGGGWKKLGDQAVGHREFSASLKDVCGLAQVHDYYGMAEQTGCIYMQCQFGHLHASVFSDIIPRRTQDFSPCRIGEPGVLEVVSSLPESYPGHCLLTEDEGTLLGEDNCPCGRKGKFFAIHGRIHHAELRGCSDTYAQQF